MDTVADYTVFDKQKSTLLRDRELTNEYLGCGIEQLKGECCQMQIDVFNAKIKSNQVDNAVWRTVLLGLYNKIKPYNRKHVGRGHMEIILRVSNSKYVVTDELHDAINHLLWLNGDEKDDLKNRQRGSQPVTTILKKVG